MMMLKKPSMIYKELLWMVRKLKLNGEKDLRILDRLIVNREEEEVASEVEEEIIEMLSFEVEAEEKGEAEVAEVAEGEAA